MIYPVVRELADDNIPVAVACRVLGVSTSGYYDWRDRPTSERERSDLHLVEVIRQVHSRSRQTYGSPRIHAELRLGRDIRVGRKRVERLMCEHGIVSVHHRQRLGCTWRDPAADSAPDLVNRRFVADRPDALWVSDITQHRTDQGWVYCAVKRLLRPHISMPGSPRRLRSRTTRASQPWIGMPERVRRQHDDVTEKLRVQREHFGSVR